MSYYDKVSLYERCVFSPRTFFQLRLFKMMAPLSSNSVGAIMVKIDSWQAVEILLNRLSRAYKQAPYTQSVSLLFILVNSVISLNFTLYLAQFNEFQPPARYTLFS